MDKLYLVTGGTGHLGSMLVHALKDSGQTVRVLCMPNDKTALPPGVQRAPGDICDKASLAGFFDTGGYTSVTLIHCAAIVTIATRYNPAVWATNVTGTQNLLSWCFERQIDRVIYVSSVHAIPEQPAPAAIAETEDFAPDQVVGQYAKSKAAATALVLDAAKAGLNISVVHPSGILGIGDLNRTSPMNRIVEAVARGRLRIGLHGGYDFVDVRDVVQGILACETRGRRGHCYILSGCYQTVRDVMTQVCRTVKRRPPRVYLPAGFAARIAEIGERVTERFRRKPFFTPYAVWTLQTNAVFSRDKAWRELSYQPRPFTETIRDVLEERLQPRRGRKVRRTLSWRWRRVSSAMV